MKYLSLIAAVTAASAAIAHSGATGIVLERMQDMESVGQNMRAISEMLSGERDRDDPQIAARALAIAEVGGAGLVAKFPEGTGDAPSEAAATIWTDAEGFLASAVAMSDAAESLAEAASGGGDIAGAFRALGGTCKSCHEGYRVNRD